MPLVVKVVTPPAVEPVTLAEAKLHLKMDSIAADDSLIDRKISAARRYCEVIAKRTFVNTVFELIDDAFPFTGGTLNRQVRQFYGQFSNGGGAVFPGVTALNAGVIIFPRAPIVSVQSVTYTDASGSLQTMDASRYVVTTGAPGRLCAAFGGSWPATLPVNGAVTIRFTAGYGADASTVVATDKEAVLLYLGYSYRDRDGSAPPTAINAAIASLLGCENNAGGYS